MKTLIGRNNRHFFRRIKWIISYSFILVKKLGGVFTSKHRSTYLLFYRKSEFRLSFRDKVRYAFLALFVITPLRLYKVYRLEKRIKRIREKEIQKLGDSDYLYVWILAQKKEHKSIDGLVEVKNGIINRALELNLPIYMETTEQRLVPMYERIGFRFYDFIEEPSGMKLWFGRFCPETNPLIQNL